MVELYSITYVYHILFVHPSFNGPLGCFQTHIFSFLGLE